jgi:phospholipase C
VSTGASGRGAGSSPTRRGVLTGGLIALGAAACASSGSGKPTPPRSSAARPTPSISPSALPSQAPRPGSLPNPRLPAGTDTLPEIEHIVVLMMENHSYDNYLGMLRRGDGFTLDKSGRPTAANRDASGRSVPAFHLAETCQLSKQPSQSWDASHIQYDGGRDDGFVRSDSGPVSMGYWKQQDLPFYYGLATTFPLADRYFSSVLAQTYPNRRFLLAGTAYGLVDNRISSVTAPGPPNGTIFDRLNQHSITWKNYFSSLATCLLVNGIHQKNPDKLVPIADFFKDAAAGTLPSYSLVDPDFEKSSEENPQNILVGEAFAASVINAVMNGPLWSKTLLVWCYDEHGGYYDHVPPPAAIAPDSIAPVIAPQKQPGSYDRYGFRVPAVMISPYARRDYVTSQVFDHTSVLKLVEQKWNLPPLTARDAAAVSPLDALDFDNPPAFAEPPELPEPALRWGSWPAEV